MPPRLTIAIPTFNRNQILADALRALTPQLTPDVLVLIIDNCSTVPVESTLGVIDPRVRIVRNSVNLGGNGNILRCVERCETPWIWILGDDDRPEPNAIEIALADIGRFPDAVCLNYSTRGEFSRTSDFCSKGRSEFLGKVDSFGNLLFVSSSLYRTACLQGQMSFGHHFAYSCAPHLAMLLMAMDRDTQVMFLRASLVSWERTSVEIRGSLITIALGLPILLDLPILASERRILARSLSRFPRTAAIVHHTLLQIIYAGVRPGEARKTFKTIMGRIPMRLAPMRTLIGQVWSVMLLFPRPTYFLFVKPLYRRMTGHESGPNKLGIDRL